MQCNERKEIMKEASIRFTRIEGRKDGRNVSTTRVPCCVICTTKNRKKRRRFLIEAAISCDLSIGQLSSPVEEDFKVGPALSLFSVPVVLPEERSEEGPNKSK